MYEIFRLLRDRKLADVVLGFSDVLADDPKDNRRAHIMGFGVSTKTGSVIWHGIDIASKSDRRIERRDLADRILALWEVAG